MNWKLGLAVVGFFAATLFASAGPLDGKTPGYFTDRYGPAKASRSESKLGFVYPKRGAVNVKGQFSVREFRKDNLRIEAIYFIPSLEPAVIRLRLNRQWTKEPIEAALAAYGGKWKPIDRNGVVNTWEAPDGSLAISLLTTLEIQSKTVVELVARSLAEEDAKRKAVPQF